MPSKSKRNTASAAVATPPPAASDCTEQPAPQRAVPAVLSALFACAVSMFCSADGTVPVRDLPKMMQTARMVFDDADCDRLRECADSVVKGALAKETVLGLLRAKHFEIEDDMAPMICLLSHWDLDGIGYISLGDACTGWNEACGDEASKQTPEQLRELAKEAGALHDGDQVNYVALVRGLTSQYGSRPAAEVPAEYDTEAELGGCADGSDAGLGKLKKEL